MINTHMAMLDHTEYMSERFSLCFTIRYSTRPHMAQVECDKADDGFGNVVWKDSEDIKTAYMFIDS